MSNEEGFTQKEQESSASGEGQTPDAVSKDADPEVLLSEQVQQLTDEKREINDRFLRLAAEFENFKRRARKEQEDAAARGLEQLLRDLLPAMDNFDRALSASKNPSTTVASLVEGVQMVQRSFLSALEKSNIKPFDAEGKPFDPNIHEAIGQIDSTTLPPGHVATVFQRGYLIGSRLLRPALVQVTRKPSGTGPDATPEQAN